MTNSKDPLSQLWQSQPVQSIDMEELKAHWKKNQRKQWCWIVSDCIALVLGVAFCAYVLVTDENLFRRVWSAGFITILLAMTPYLFKLRMGSLGIKVPTNEYLQRLIQQKLNNIKIARITIWLMIFIAIFFAGWSTAYYVFYQPAAYSFFLKTLKGAAFIGFMSFIMAIWARREIKKSSELLAHYQRINDEL